MDPCCAAIACFTLEGMTPSSPLLLPFRLDASASSGQHVGDVAQLVMWRSRCLGLLWSMDCNTWLGVAHPIVDHAGFFEPLLCVRGAGCKLHYLQTHT